MYRIIIGLLCTFSFATAAFADRPATSLPSRLSPQIVVQQRDMTFTSDGAQLSGTLYYPQGNRRVAALVVLHGASEPSRDDGIYKHLKQMLPPLGIAVFVFDRRGTGRSGGGEHGKQDFAVLTDDALAAFRMLSNDPLIDSKRIGFWGLSQGGGLSLLAAKKEPRAAFAIAVSPLISTADVQMMFASENIMRIKGYPQSEIDQAMAMRRAIDDYDRGKVERVLVERMLAAAEHKPWFKEIYLGRDMIEPKSDWREEISADPMKALNGSRVPTLILFGQNDVWIPVGAALNQLQAKSTLLPNLTARVISGATHEMMLGVDPKEEIDPAFFSKFAPNAPEYFGVMSAWLGEHHLTSMVRFRARKRGR